jgi:hypothetical protein
MRQANFRGNVFEFLEAGGKDNAEACLPCLPAGRRQAGAEGAEARGENRVRRILAARAAPDVANPPHAPRLRLHQDGADGTVSTSSPVRAERGLRI